MIGRPSMGPTIAGLVIVVCAVCLALLSSAALTDARSSMFSRLESSNADRYFRSIRNPGFRQGAIDRVGHQFGKRSELDELLAPPSEQPAEFIITDEYVATALSSDPKLALLFVRHYIDANNDGFITSSELQPSLD